MPGTEPAAEQSSSHPAKPASATLTAGGLACPPERGRTEPLISVGQFAIPESAHSKLIAWKLTYQKLVEYIPQSGPAVTYDAFMAYATEVVAERDCGTAFLGANALFGRFKNQVARDGRWDVILRNGLLYKRTRQQAVLPSARGMPHLLFCCLPMVIDEAMTTAQLAARINSQFPHTTVTETQVKNGVHNHRARLDIHSTKLCGVSRYYREVPASIPVSLPATSTSQPQQAHQGSMAAQLQALSSIKKKEGAAQKEDVAAVIHPSIHVQQSQQPPPPFQQQQGAQQTKDRLAQNDSLSADLPWQAAGPSVHHSLECTNTTSPVSSSSDLSSPSSLTVAKKLVTSSRDASEAQQESHETFQHQQLRQGSSSDEPVSDISLACPAEANSSGPDQRERQPTDQEESGAGQPPAKKLCR